MIFWTATYLKTWKVCDMFSVWFFGKSHTKHVAHLSCHQFGPGWITVIMRSWMGGEIREMMFEVLGNGQWTHHSRATGIRKTNKMKIGNCWCWKLIKSIFRGVDRIFQMRGENVELRKLMIIFICDSPPQANFFWNRVFNVHCDS